MRKIREFFIFILLLSLFTACNKNSENINMKQNQSSNLDDKADNNKTLYKESIKQDPYLALISSQEWQAVKFPASDKIYPFSPPNGENLASSVIDSSFERDSRYLYLDFNATYDEDIKRTGTRSIKLSKKDEALRVYGIPVDEGRWYVISGYMFAKSLPTDIARLHIAYAGDGRHINSVNYSVISTSTPNEWEEFVIPFYVQKNKGINQIRVTIRNEGEMKTNDINSSDVWIDDLQVFEVQNSTKLFGLDSPSQKREFNGEKVRIDKLGNWEVKEDGKWQAFFPIAIYPDDDDESKKNNWQIYKEKGFNVITRVNLPDAKRVADLGMYWVWDIGHYGIYDGSAIGADKFANDYKNLRENSKQTYDKLLNFYWDNEQYDEFDSIRLLTDKVKEIDIDKNSNRIRPLYMHLDFVAGNKNYYNEKYQFMDIQGVYANDLLYKADDIQSYGVEMQGNYNAEFSNFSLFENINRVKTPKSIFVINSPFELDNIEVLIFAAIARGGKGFAFWKDGGSQPSIETKAWWSDFDKVTQKIQKLLPIIREPHWSDWELKYSKADDEDGLVVGTRDFNNKRVMIVANRSDTQTNVTFTTPDKVIGGVRDYYTGEIVANGIGNSFTLTVLANGSGVYYWE